MKNIFAVNFTEANSIVNGFDCVSDKCINDPDNVSWTDREHHQLRWSR